MVVSERVRGRDLLGIGRQKILSIFLTLFTEQIQVKQNNSGREQNQEVLFYCRILGGFSFQYDTFLSTREQNLRNSKAGLLILSKMIPSKRCEGYNHGPLPLRFII